MRFRGEGGFLFYLICDLFAYEKDWRHYQNLTLFQAEKRLYSFLFLIKIRFEW